MSLEAAIERNTAAIEKLIAILGADAVPGSVPPSDGERIMDKVNLDPGAVNEAPKAKRTKKEAAPVAQPGEPAWEAPAPSPEAGATAAPATVAAAPATEAPTYDQAAAAITALIKANGRDAAIGLLKRFNATNLKGVDPSQYSALISQARDEAVPF